MSRMARWTITDIAREARVSKTTVSRVLNGRPDVDGDTSARVLKLIDDVGYVRSARALQLAKGHANAVGLLAPFDTSPWMVEVLRGAMDKVHPTSFNLTLHAIPETPADEARLSAELQSGAMDALLVVSLQRPLEAVARAAEEGLPVVMLNDYGCNGGLADVVPDESVGISAAVDHLAAVGRRRFAIITGAKGNPVTDLRLAAYRTSLLSHGFALDRRLVVGADFTAAGAQSATAELLGRGVPLDALFASSDAMAVGAMRALKGAGLTVPGDVSVVGFDDFASAEFTEPRLTTVHNPLYEMSARAAQRLLEALHADRDVSPGEDVVTTHLIIRDSSDPRPQGGSR
jgi:LacI family transcriptional regulator, galactose operon repressor